VADFSGFVAWPLSLLIRIIRCHLISKTCVKTWLKLGGLTNLDLGVKIMVLGG